LWKVNTTCLEFSDEDVGLAERQLLLGGLRVRGVEGGTDPLPVAGPHIVLMKTRFVGIHL
jgi:hypothetical protein